MSGLRPRDAAAALLAFLAAAAVLLAWRNLKAEPADDVGAETAWRQAAAEDLF